MCHVAQPVLQQRVHMLVALQVSHGGCTQDSGMAVVHNLGAGVWMQSLNTHGQPCTQQCVHPYGHECKHAKHDVHVHCAACMARHHPAVLHCTHECQSCTAHVKALDASQEMIHGPDAHASKNGAPLTVRQSCTATSASWCSLQPTEGPMRECTSI